MRNKYFVISLLVLFFSFNAISFEYENNEIITKINSQIFLIDSQKIDSQKKFIDISINFDDGWGVYLIDTNKKNALNILSKLNLFTFKKLISPTNIKLFENHDGFIRIVFLDDNKEIYSNYYALIFEDHFFYEFLKIISFISFLFLIILIFR